MFVELHARPAMHGAASRRLASRHLARAHVLLDRWAASQSGRFLPWLPFFMASGAAWYFTLPAEPDPRIPWLLLPIAAALLAARRLPLACGALLGIGALVAGISAAELATMRAAPPQQLPFKAVQLQGTVTLLERLPEGSRITVQGAHWDGHPAPLPATLRLRLRKDDPAAPEPGSEVALRALMRAPSPPSLPGGWDMQRDAFYAGSAGGGFALGPLEVLAPAPTSRLAQARHAIAARFHAGLPGTEGAIAATLFTGLSAAIPPADRAAFRDSGLAHLLAVAGLHIGAVMGAVFFALRLILARSERAALFWPCRQIAGGGALVAGFCYLLLTGAHVPIQRSFAMAVLVTLGLLVGRRALSLRGLAFAAIAILLATPSEVMGVSFQMSFAAVLALIAGFEAARPWLHRLRHRRGGRWLAHGAALALTSLLAGAASAPFGAYHFGQIQLYFILANLVAVPITALLAMPLGLLALALMPLGLEQVALLPMGWCIEALLAIARMVAALPDAVLHVPQMPGWGLGACALGIAWLGIWRGGFRLVGMAPLLLGLVSPALVTPPDLLVAADGHMVGLRSATGIEIVSVSGASHYVRDSWLQSWGEQTAARDCLGAACTLRPRPDAPAALVLRSGPADCAAAPVLVIALGRGGNSCPGAPSIDRARLAREGAMAVWLDPHGLRLVSDQQLRGDRPWMPRPFLPPAAIEELPPLE